MRLPEREAFRRELSLFVIDFDVLLWGVGARYQVVRGGPEVVQESAPSSEEVLERPEHRGKSDGWGSSTMALGFH
jgi:hypothetical protein